MSRHEIRITDVQSKADGNKGTGLMKRNRHDVPCEHPAEMIGVAKPCNRLQIS